MMILSYVEVNGKLDLIVFILISTRIISVVADFKASINVLDILSSAFLSTFICEVLTKPWSECERYS